jgi:hypothetical protein
MSRTKLTDLKIWMIYLTHPRTGAAIDSLGVRKSLMDDGEAVDINFHFKNGKNEELTNVLFGVDYEILRNQKVTNPINIDIDGTYSLFTETPIKLLSLDKAIARSKDAPIRVVSQLKDSDTRAIAYCPDTDRFVRSSDLRNKRIDLYRADAVYPRWVETPHEMGASREGDINVINKQERRLKTIHLKVFTVEDGQKWHRQYDAVLEYIPPAERGTIRQPRNARRIRFKSLTKTHHNLLVENAEPVAAKA